MTHHNKDGPIIITGGAGFIGTNLAKYFINRGFEVIIIDNLSRSGSERNLEYLMSNFRKRLQIIIADVRDHALMRNTLNDASFVFHFAAQVAVTESISNPVQDFHINCHATLNLLEILRSMSNPPFFLFTSTNKVYGDLENVSLSQNAQRYFPDPKSDLYNGVDESWCLDFHSPYGCSKGSADQYVLDYARIFGIPAAVFRMSCIYGPHQYGTEDQGWIGHFIIKSILDEPVIIYGDGRQVRDILYIDDLVNAFAAVFSHQEICTGQVFTIGGGIDHTISILEFVEILKEISGKPLKYDFSDWRQGDQKYYVSNFKKFQSLFNWKPSVKVKYGIETLYHWLLTRIPAEYCVLKENILSLSNR